MHTGMLWFDNSQTELTVKIQKAVAHYVKKYGRKPDLCLVHPSMMTQGQRRLEIDSLLEIDNLVVLPYRPVLPGHIWVGISDKQ